MLFTKLALLTMAVIPGHVQAELPGFRQIGQTLSSDPGFGSFVDLSTDGNVMAVAGDAHVSVFRRDDSSVVEDIAETNWELLSNNISFADQSGGFSLSDDGELLAVRHDDKIELHGINTGDMEILNVCAGGERIKLANDPTSYWLLISCEDLSNNRGMVEIWRFHNSGIGWLHQTTISGRFSGAAFGSSIDINLGSGQNPTVAIASPHFNNDQGMVQIFEFPPTGGYHKLGNDLLGEKEGDMFGYSVGLGTSEVPRFVVVGAPECGDNSQGCVSTYTLSRQSKNDEATWQPLGLVLQGSAKEKFGVALAASKTGTRFAASSVDYKSQSGIIRLYELGSTKPIGVLEGGTKNGHWGNSVVLNEAGSLVASGSPTRGTVQVFLDHTPFCGVPIKGFSNEQMFLARPVCKNIIGAIVKTQNECEQAYTYLHGSSCEWIADLSTGTPSSMPSSSPSQMPSLSSSPSVYPSMTPSVSATSAPPTSAPSASPSWVPSSSPSQPRSHAPSSSPAQAPSFGPTIVPQTSAPSSQSPWIVVLSFTSALLVGTLFHSVRKWKKNKGESAGNKPESPIPEPEDWQV